MLTGLVLPGRSSVVSEVRAVIGAAARQVSRRFDEVVEGVEHVHAVEERAGPAMRLQAAVVFAEQPRQRPHRAAREDRQAVADRLQRRRVEQRGPAALHHVGEQRHPGAEARDRSEEHTSELQSLMRISYAVFCLKKKKKKTKSN